MRDPNTIRRGTRSVYGQGAVRSGVLVGLLLFVFVLVGCAIVPMKTRTVGTTGKENKMDFKFIQADKTTRDEVATNLAWMDTGLKHQRLFWGRWYGSSSGVGSIFVPTEIPLPIPNGTRHWHAHNLLVEFNAREVVERFGEFSDGNLNEELERWLKELNEPPLNLSAPLVIQMETTPTDSKVKEELEHWLKEANEPPLDPSVQAQLINQMRTPLMSMTLTGDLLQFVLWNGQTFSVPPKDITRFQIHNVWLPGDRDFWGGGLTAPPSGLYVLFSFRHWGPGGKGHCKCYMMEVSPADYLMLVRYMGQTGART